MNTNYNTVDFMHPDLYNLFKLFKTEAEKRGINFMLTSVARTWQQQVALFAQGRENLTVVNNLRRFAGLSQFKLGNILNKVTWTLNSLHIINLEDQLTENNLSNAFDLAVLSLKIPTWNLKADVNNDQKPDYFQLGEIWENLGQTWGGKFKNPDYCHFQRRMAV